MGMTKEEAINLLSNYKYANVKSQLMLQKIHKMEETIYSAQAGYVENETGVRTSGGNHISREQKISELVDLRNQFSTIYTQNEVICYNTMQLIQAIYSKNEKIQDMVKSASGEALKLEKYEVVLIAYYINNLTIEEIGKMNGYGFRQSQRLLNAARDAFFQEYKEFEFEWLKSLIAGDSSTIEKELMTKVETGIN